MRDFVLGQFQQYLRNQSLFTLWNVQGEKLEPQFAKNNFHPKSTVVENCVFPALGRGNWAACVEGIVQGREWTIQPWEAVSLETLKRHAPTLVEQLEGKSEKVFPGDSVGEVGVYQGSSTDLAHVPAADIKRLL